MILTLKKDTFTPLFHAVGCLCKFKNKFLILKRANKKSYPFRWGIPTGKLNNNELISKTIVRELYEETRILCSAENLKFVDSFHIENDNMNFTYSMFVLELSQIQEIILNPTEHTEYNWIAFNELDNFLLVPDVKETIAVALNRKLHEGVQLNLFTGEPDEEEVINIFYLQKDYEISHDSFKKNICLDKKWFVSFGPPGAGKSSTLKQIQVIHPEFTHCFKNILKRTLNFRTYLDKAFIEKEHKYFFNFQLEVLQLRFWQSFYAPNNSIVDESIFSTLAYSKALYSLKWIDEYMFETFYRNYCSYQVILVPPVKILYFFCDTDTLIRRIKKRGRAHEKYYSTKYIEQLNIEFKETAYFLKKNNYDIEFIDTNKFTTEEIANHLCENILKKSI